MKSSKKWKKGSLLDLITLIFIPIILIVTGVGLYISYNELNDGLAAAAPLINSTAFDNSIQTIDTPARRVAPFWDVIIIFIIFGSWLAMMAVSFILGNNPLFLTFFIAASFGLIVFAIMAQFALQMFIENESIMFFQTEFPMTTFFINWMIVFSILFILGVGTALYMKPESQ